MSGHADACGQPSGHWSGRPVSEHRVRPLVTAVRGDRLPSPSGVWTLGARGLDARVVLGGRRYGTGSGHGGCGTPEQAPWSERCSARPWTAVDMTASGRRWRSWTWLSGAVSAADTTVRTPGRITAVWPQQGPRPSGRTATADTSLEGASRHSAHPECCADGA